MSPNQVLSTYLGGGVIPLFQYVLILCLAWGCDDHSQSSVENFVDYTSGRIDPSILVDISMSDVGVADNHIDQSLSTLGESALSEQRAEGIFREGCPKMGFAHARQLQGPGELEGEAVIADRGDLILMNDRVAYIIQDPTQSSRTWWYYGGQIVDAVPLEDCMQTDEDRLNSLGMVIGEGEITALDQAVMRAFKGQRADIIHDGHGGGAARVRVYGIDAPMWLVEAELLSMAMKAGRPKLKSEELGVNMWVDYILPPDDTVIQIEVGVTNLLGEARTLRMSALSFFGDKAYTQRFAPGQLNIGGIRLLTGLPWLSAGNLALALDSNNMATAHFAGVDLFIDVSRFVTGDRLQSYLGAEFDSIDEKNREDSTIWSMNLSVHGDGLSRATHALAQYFPNPSLGRIHQPQMVTLEIEYNEADSEAINELGDTEAIHPIYRREARLEVWIMEETSEGQWIEVGQVGEHRLTTDSILSRDPITFPLPGLLVNNEHYQLRLWVPGITELRSPLFILDEDGQLPLELRSVILPARGLLNVNVLNQMGDTIPATLRLSPMGELSSSSPIYQPSFNNEVIHIIEHEMVWVPSGRYQYTLSRGYEYEPIQGELEVVSGEITEHTMTLQHMNPIGQYLSFDGHVHAGPSPDSDVLINQRLRGAAAEGVDIVAGSDHEIITDWADHMDEQLSKWILPIIAEEATASLPEHMNIYPIPPRTDILRGDPPRWYGLGFDRFIDTLYERGAQVVQLNHPRQGCNYLCLIGYDRELGEPDPNLNTLHFGYEEGEIWGWDFNAVELLNDSRPLFMDLDQPESTGYYEDWASFINLGHSVTGLGVSDIHGADGIGVPVTLVRLTEGDRVARVGDTSPDMLGEAIVQGRAQVSLGAWIDLDINGASLGELAQPYSPDSSIEDHRFDLNLIVRSVPSIDVSWVYVFVNCDLTYSWEAQSPLEVVKHRQAQSIILEEDAWITVMAFGDDAMPPGLPNYDPRVTPRVITNPIYLDGDGDGSWTAPGGKSCLIPEGRRP